MERSTRPLDPSTPPPTIEHPTDCSKLFSGGNSEDDANLLKDTFAPHPPQGDQGSQDLSSRKPQQRGFCWFWSMIREICQRRQKHLLDSCRRGAASSSPKFLPLSQQSWWLVRLHDEKRDSEQIRSAFSHSDDLRRLATFSTLQKNLLFTRSSKQGLVGLSDPHLPPQAAGLLKSALREPVLPLPPRADQVAGGASYLPRGAHCAPAGKLVHNQHLGN